MQLPITMPGLGHVNCYVLEDSEGVALVDPGLPGDDSWKTLVARLGSAGVPLDRVHTVVITHSHPDHYGGSHRLRAETGAKVLTHRAFRNWWDFGGDESPDGTADGTADGTTDGTADADDAPRPEADPVLSQTGRPRPSTPEGRGATMLRLFAPWARKPNPAEAKRLRASLLQRTSPVLRPPEPDQTVDHQERVTLAGREWLALHTPGHTPDHLCLYDPANGVVFSGDHVLPTITPHIAGLVNGTDALERFVESLDLMATLPDVRQVLPAHGHPFKDLAGRADAIKTHHRDRLERLLRAVVVLGPASVEELSHRLFPERSWGPMAESETYAHLEHLRLAGELQSDQTDGVLRYRR